MVLTTHSIYSSTWQCLGPAASPKPVLQPTKRELVQYLFLATTAGSTFGRGQDWLGKLLHVPWLTRLVVQLTSLIVEKTTVILLTTNDGVCAREKTAAGKGGAPLWTKL
jgi:hypothetical protein